MKKIGILLLFVMLGFAFISTESSAAKIKELKEKKTYQFNLDKKGKKEKISYRLDKKGRFRINVNGKETKIKLNDEFYSAQVQITDIDKKDGSMDIFAYAYCFSEDVGYAALFQYKKSKLTRIWKMPSKEVNAGFYARPGYLLSADGKGNFTVCMDRALQTDAITGNHLDKVEYKLKKKKVVRVSKNEFKFAKTYAMRDDGMGLAKDNGLKLKREVLFYKDADKTGEIAFTGTIGTKMYPKKVYVTDEGVVYVQYATKLGLKGWLCAEDYVNDAENPVFANMLFAD